MRDLVQSSKFSIFVVMEINDKRNPRYREYRTWVGIKERCFNKKHHNYIKYGAKGITVCNRWKNSFEAFYADMGPKPSLKHSIDRYPNGQGHYEPGNCRWANSYQQSQNRKGRILSHEKADAIRIKYSEGVLMKDLAIEYGVSAMMIGYIIKNKAWIK